MIDHIFFLLQKLGHIHNEDTHQKNKRLWKYLMEIREHIWDERTKRRNDALTRTKHINKVEDTWNLDEEETSERKRCRGVVTQEMVNQAQQMELVKPYLEEEAAWQSRD